MTCFWDGILGSLTQEDFETTFGIERKPNNIDFVKLLQKSNKHTENVKWNNTVLTNKELEENYEHIKDYDINTMNQGYLCSTCDPFLLLTSEIFSVNIYHKYCGNVMQYITLQSKKTLYFSSNRGHFTTCSQFVV